MSNDLGFLEWLSGPVVLGVLAVLLIGVYLSWTAGRVDRLHARVEGARSALDAQLMRRSSVALEMATSALLDPAATILVAGAAHEAREADPEDQEQAESDLTGAVRAALEQPGQAEALASVPEGQHLLDELDAASRRVVMARRFHNEAVRATLAVRRRRLVRYLRLAGRAALPRTFEIDDSLPHNLSNEL